MKKNFLLSVSIVLASLIIGGFFYYAQKFKYQASEQVKEFSIIENNKDINDKLFFLNQECLEMKNGISERLSKKNSSYGDLSLEQLFYSPTKNSCLYVEYSQKGVFYNKRLMDVMRDGDSAEALVMCTAGHVSQELANYYENDQSAYYEIISGCDSFDNEINAYR